MGYPKDFLTFLKQLSGGDVLLQVGTIEPRKGHSDSLAAMERLWAEGSSLKLVLVGGVGWKMDAFMDNLHNHPEFGQRLFWTGRVSDEALDVLYATCTGTIFPSLAEGFVLPVVESLAHQRPVLARRLDVFKGLEGHGVTLFDVNATPDALASEIAAWIEGPMRQPFTCPRPRPSWADAGDFILQQIADQRIDRK
ncbi:glycosyltransferase [Pantanalinema rosaneae CENA516]|uniref:glycosyltransferase n=1 Tax=Pantanalinema rosaneae TaxID=1620701 RepID=UPI003D6F321C